jgi:hypothetical protein
MCVKFALKANIKGHLFLKDELIRALKLLELMHSDVVFLEGKKKVKGVHDNSVRNTIHF